MTTSELSGRFLFRELDPFKERWEVIRDYYSQLAPRMPPNSREFALADWHYAFNDPRCPHDSWIRTIDVEFEKALDTGELRRTVRLSLLGPYHDRIITFSYGAVTGFAIVGQLVCSDNRNLDWIYDEVHLNEEGQVIHIIDFEKAVIEIICADFTYSSTPCP